MAPGTLTFPLIQRYVRDVLTVNDAQLIEAMRFFAERMKMVVEPTGCLGAAAVFNQTVPVKGRRIGVLISGGNVDMQAYRSEEHTSELQSLMRNSYAVFCLKTKTNKHPTHIQYIHV